MLEIKPCNKNWHTRGDDTAARIAAAAPYAEGKIVDAANTVKVLEAVLRRAIKSISKAITRNRRISSRKSSARWIRPKYMIFI